MAGEATGFRDLTVTARRLEGERVVSLSLAAADGSPLPAFEPGQFLTFRLAGPDGRPVPRNYSLSGDPADRSHYRISVRREGPTALGSGHMHEQAVIGACLQASGPKGRFVLDRASRRPVILIAEDIGLTPLLAMAHALAADPARAALLVHIARAPGEAIFADELASLAATAPNLQVRRLSDGAAPLTAAHLTAWLPIGDYEAYLCGPQSFLDATAALLDSLGLRPERIRTETFGPAAAPRPAAGIASPGVSAPIAAPSAAPAPAPAPAGAAPRPGIQPTVTFEPAGRSIVWDPACRTLLDFAEANGLAPAYSCRNGICGTCRAAVDGLVTYLEEPLDMPEPGFALLCCSAPAGPVTVRL
ncbi:flavin reductase family protein [Prosthecodimorpha staleyi]|uniref:Iron-sulfur cluster-binding domain-containing protein n=1 Tax=Prosthecodimorpha staleyi TaxID=2840188 RepID=A0A947D1B2_9HYPH|nr:iron-sulfur cluster-binding domain-containing protein [Prosthecodimorpha staleyi]MBT9288519.1 iron-sulfur cluster-binding domain-containing protein [Prosthecodimorpha staleyi]